MKILKKSLSFSLILSILCTSIVFMGAVPAFADAAYLPIEGIDSSSGGTLSAGDSLYIDFDIPASTIEQTTSTARIMFSKPGSTSADFYTLQLSGSGDFLSLMLNNWSGTVPVTGVLPSGDYHVTLKHHRDNDDIYGVTSVYINGVLVKEYENTSTGNAYVHPAFGQTIAKVRHDNALFTDITAVKTSENLDTQYTANFTVNEGVTDVVISGEDCDDAEKSVDTPIFYDWKITCTGEMTAQELVTDRLSYTGTLKLKRGTQVITDIASAGDIRDGDILILESRNGGLSNEYKVIVSAPLRLTLPTDTEYDDFTEITAEVSDDVAELADVKLFINDTEDTGAVCDINGKTITFTGFNAELGQMNVRVQITDIEGNTYQSQKTTNVTLLNPLTLQLGAAMNYDSFNSIKAKVSRYFSADNLSAGLFFDGEEQTAASWSIDDAGVLTFENFTIWQGPVNIKAEITYNNTSYSDEVSVLLEKYEFASDTSWPYWDIWSKSMPDNRANYIDYEYQGTNNFSHFTGKSNSSSVTLRTQFIGNAPGSDVKLYKLSFPLKLNGNTGITLTGGFADSSATTFSNLMGISPDDTGLTYKAVGYDADGSTEVFANGLLPDTVYNLEAIVNTASLTADYKLTDSDGNAFVAYGITVPQDIAEKTFKQFRLNYSIPNGEGPVAIGAATLDYGKIVNIITQTPSDDSSLTLGFASQPTIADGKNIADYIEITDASGNEIHVYDARILNNEIKFMSNEISRGETYNVTVSPDLNLDGSGLGVGLKTSVTVPFKDFDVTDVNISKTSSDADITVTLQNLNLAEETVTMIVNVTELQNGREVTKAVYLKTCPAPDGMTSFDAVFNDIPLSGGQSIKVFFADGTANFGALTNRIYEN